MKKISVPITKVSSQDINLAKSSKAMADVEAILKLSPEERKARLIEISQKSTQGSLTLYEEKVLTKLLSPGQAEWIKLVHSNLPQIEAKLKHVAEKENLAAFGPAQIHSVPTTDSITRSLDNMTVRSVDSREQSTETTLTPYSLKTGMTTYVRGFLTGMVVLGLLGSGIWYKFNSEKQSKPEVSETFQPINNASLPSDTLQVIQAKLDKGQKEVRLGDFTKGESELKEIIVKYSETSQAEEAYMILAEAYRHRSHKFDKALQTYQAFLEKYPNSAQTGLVLLKMGFCYEDIEDKRNAMTLYKSVLQRNGEKSRVGQLAAERLKTLNAQQ
jgi:TolA-binding protein